MITSEAVKKVMETRSKYRISQDMGCAPVLVNYWLTGTKMGAQYRVIFEIAYGIEIDDNSMEAPSTNS